MAIVTAAKLTSLVALVAIVMPSVLFFTGAIDHQAVKYSTLVGTFVWFAATPLWMGRKLPIDAAEVEI